MDGKIIKGIAGFYYVHTKSSGVYECSAKGIFRNRNLKPLVGDDVCIDIISESDKTGSIREIYPRKNELIRPAVANIDQALVVFAPVSPAPNFNLLSRFLIAMKQCGVETTVCFNKSDEADGRRMEELCSVLSGCRNKVIVTSTVTGYGMNELRDVLLGKTTALAGPSGVGKSSILNRIFPEADSATGEISAKIGRGRHTTRHSEIFNVDCDTYIMDTPGFTSFDAFCVEPEELRFYFDEFEQYEGRCRFNGCVHINEPDCAVKEAVASGEINSMRYDIYRQLYNELKCKRKY